MNPNQPLCSSLLINLKLPDCVQYYNGASGRCCVFAPGGVLGLWSWGEHKHTGKYGLYVVLECHLVCPSLTITSLRGYTSCAEMFPLHHDGYCVGVCFPVVVKIVVRRVIWLFCLGNHSEIKIKVAVCNAHNYIPKQL
jgi:hypothetical protein